MVAPTPVWVVVALLATGCSVNGFGVSDTTVARTDGATVVTVRTYGIALDTRPRLAGVTLGFGRTILVLPDERKDIEPTDPTAIIPAATPVLIHRRVAGVELGLNQETVGIAVGLSETLLNQPIGPGESVFRLLTFDPDAPERTFLKQCRGEIGC